MDAAVDSHPNVEKHDVRMGHPAGLDGNLSLFESLLFLTPDWLIFLDGRHIPGQVADSLVYFRIGRDRCRRLGKQRAPQWHIFRAMGDWHIRIASNDGVNMRVRELSVVLLGQPGEIRWRNL